MAEHRTGQDLNEAAPVIGLGSSAAGWSVAYSADGLASPASDADWEAVALRLWGEGRKDEAVAFLERRIAEEKAQVGASPPGEPESRASRALALITSSPAPSLTPPAATGVPLPALNVAEAADTPGKLIHMAPEPRVDDARQLRRARTSRPTWLMAAALLLGSVGFGSAFWSGDGGETTEPADPVELRAALPAERPQQVAAVAQAPAAAAPAVAKPLPVGAPLGAVADEQAEPPPEPAELVRRPPAPRSQFGPPAPEPKQQALAPSREPARSTARAPDESAPPAQAVERPVQTARLPQPRPRYIPPQPAAEPDAPPEQVAIVEIPPLRPDYERSLQRQAEYWEGRDYLPEDDEEDFAEEYDAEDFDYVPPRLAERRAAAARYAAARRREAQHMDRSQQHIIFREAPVFTIEAPGILDSARGLLGQ